MNIFVANLPYSATEDQLRDAFAAHGDVASAKIITDQETGRSRGFGFVEMPDDHEAAEAIEALNEADMDGRPLKVNEAKPREDRGNRGGSGGGGYNRR
jgi:RNA recognition motif-containing protein